MTQYKLKPEIKERWVKALRSGDYSQGKRRLCSLNGSFCCLGVLSDLYAREHPDTTIWVNNNKVSDVYLDYDNSLVPEGALFISGEAVLTPPFVDAWAYAGVTEQQTQAGIDPTMPLKAPSLFAGRSLTSLNDAGVTFNVIADLIEEYL